MKRVICLICTLIMLIGCATVAMAAEQRYNDDEQGFSITLPDGYTAINRSSLSSNKEFIERLGYSVKSFRSKMEESNIVLYAADKDNTSQIQVRVWESNFSREIKQLSGMKDEQLNETLSLLAEGIAADDAQLTDSRVTKVKKQPYLTYTVKVEDAFCYIESLTVIDGRCVALLYYNSAPEISSADNTQHQRLLSSLSVDRKGGGNWSGGYNLWLRVLCALLVLGAAVIIVYLISGFIKDIKHRKAQPDTVPDRIKMRRK